ncbi:hypothetical protein BDV93DRAFT_509024 [Ceratobasidium sp. AG-I]|nr:hypothetical protein BDV93DRAFT_509024 [Ceratobasidium sp. AG-I]
MARLKDVPDVPLKRVVLFIAMSWPLKYRHRQKPAGCDFRRTISSVPSESQNIGLGKFKLDFKEFISPRARHFIYGLLPCRQCPGEVSRPMPPSYDRRPVVRHRPLLWVLKVVLDQILPEVSNSSLQFPSSQQDYESTAGFLLTSLWIYAKTITTFLIACSGVQFIGPWLAWNRAVEV